MRKGDRRFSSSDASRERLMTYESRCSILRNHVRASSLYTFEHVSSSRKANCIIAANASPKEETERKKGLYNTGRRLSY